MRRLGDRMRRRHTQAQAACACAHASGCSGCKRHKSHSGHVNVAAGARASSDGPLYSPSSASHAGAPLSRRCKYPCRNRRSNQRRRRVRLCRHRQQGQSTGVGISAGLRLRPNTACGRSPAASIFTVAASVSTLSACGAEGFRAGPVLLVQPNVWLQLGGRAIRMPVVHTVSPPHPPPPDQIGPTGNDLLVLFDI